MTEQELKTQIRERIHRELGVMPEWMWETYWDLPVVHEQLKADTGFERDIMGEDGDIYVRDMTIAKKMVEASQRHNIRDLIELWWSVLPRRDKQAITQSWEFAYNLLDAFAPTFREWYVGTSVLTPEGTRQWFTEFFSAQVSALGDAENPPTHEVYIFYTPQIIGTDVEYHVVPFADGTLYSIRTDAQSAQASLLAHLSAFASNWGMSLSAVLRSLLTGERVPPRLVCLFERQPDFRLTPQFPPYLSAPAVARVWSTVRFSGSTKTWALRRCSLALFRSYNEALQAWNRVAPEEWRIPDYRVFRKEWTRAQKRVFSKTHAPSRRQQSSAQFTASLETKLAAPFFPLRRPETPP